jgi:hypothetical protein
MYLRFGIVGNLEALLHSRRRPFEVSGLLEVFLEVLETPALVAQLLPRIVIGIRAAVKLHAVHDSSTANDIAYMNSPRGVLHKRLRSRRHVVVVVQVGGSQVRNKDIRPVVDGSILDDQNRHYNGQPDFQRNKPLVNIPFLSSVKRLATTKPLGPPPTMT